MSVDLSSITEIRDKIGVVTKITDASGMVLWSSAPPFDGIIYLRPSADISVDSTIALVPADATAAYMLINEEVSDGASTYLDVTATADTGTVSGYAQFSLSGNVPNKITNVTNMYFAISADGSQEYQGTGNPIAHNLSLYLIINGTEYCIQSASNEFRQQGYNVKIFPYNNPYDQNEISKEELLAVVNEYVAANGTLPNMELRMSMTGYKYTDSNDKTQYGYVRVSQAYLVIECE